MSTKEAARPSTPPLHKQLHSTRRWTWWLIPRPIDWVSTGLYIGVLIPYFLNINTCYKCPSVPLWRSWLMFGCIVALLSIERVEYWLYGEEPPPGKAAALLVMRLLFIEIISWIDAFTFSPFLYLVIPFLACWYFRNASGYGLAVLFWALYTIKHTLYHYGWWDNSREIQYLVLFTLGLVFAITMANVVNKEQASRTRTERLLAALETSHRQLQTYSEQVAELATTRERNRLARDIHDTLGHYLTVINVQIEKAQAFRDKQPAVADQALSDAKRLASEALRDVRSSVGALRTAQEIFAFGLALTQLVENVRSDQCEVELRIEGKEDGISGQRLMALYRAAQEGLTNVQKHARATYVRVEAHFEEQRASLLLSDDGCGFDLSVLLREKQGFERGYGLRGIQERLELVGGSLQVESKPGTGTRLYATVPKDGDLQARYLSPTAIVEQR